MPNQNSLGVKRETMVVRKWNQYFNRDGDDSHGLRFVAARTGGIASTEYAHSDITERTIRRDEKNRLGTSPRRYESNLASGRFSFRGITQSRGWQIMENFFLTAIWVGNLGIFAYFINVFYHS